MDFWRGKPLAGVICPLRAVQGELQRLLLLSMAAGPMPFHQLVAAQVRQVREAHALAEVRLPVRVTTGTTEGTLPGDLNGKQGDLSSKYLAP